MEVVLNGRSHQLDTPADLGTLVDTQVEDRRGVAVALDGEVVPRADWDRTPLQPGTRIEIVGAVQGG